MKRASIIATVAATGGILIAGSVAGVAVINAAASNAGGATSVSLVGASASPTGSPTSSPEGAAPAATMSPLPVLPSIESGTAAGEGSAGSDRSTPAVSRESSAPDSPATASPATEPSSSGISARSAGRRAVAESGGTVLSVTSERHGGFAAWAVRIQRGDGSIITGYVDKATGTVFDWVTNRAATPSPQPSATATHGDDDADDGSEDSDQSEHEDDDGSDHDSDDD